MQVSGSNRGGSTVGAGRNRDLTRYVWKVRAYEASSPSRKKVQWKASAILGLQWLGKKEMAGHPATVVVPAVYNLMPAEAVALGWFNEIDALATIRHRMIEAAQLTGWDLFTFHTRHNLDAFYASTIAAVRETWLSEGSLKPNCIAAAVKQYGPLYEYNRVSARLVESLVFQSSLMNWLSLRAEETPLRFHVIGTSLLSALVWSGAMGFDHALGVATEMGSAWDARLTTQVEDQLKSGGLAKSDENIGWLRFRRVRQILEGRARVSLKAALADTPRVEAPAKPFWFSATPASEPALIATVNDVRVALDSMDLASWSPSAPKPLAADRPDRVRGWLVSSMHPAAGACRWSVYNFLLSTPTASTLFLDHIAALGRRPMMVPRPDENQERFRLARMKAARL
ncbi:MAG TPA: hypothetical protein VFY29_11455 [Terriglobia bacterium]|nr:hypothetical protein [Terriglobia bacterium]